MSKKGAKKFEFPPYYNLPPFFTFVHLPHFLFKEPFFFCHFFCLVESHTQHRVQPVLDTRQKQSQLWGDLILKYCQFHKIYELNIQDALNTPLFYNEAINRRLTAAGATQFIDDLAKNGNAEWMTREKQACTIFFKNVDHWATSILKWVEDCGKTDTVLTLWEIQNGEDSEDQEFYGVDQRIIMKALQLLERKGRAEIINSDSGVGVKFFTST